MQFRTSLLLIPILLLLAFTVPANAATIHEMSDSASEYNIKIVGAADGDWTGFNTIRVADWNDNGKNDLLVGSWFADNATSSGGSAWIIYDDILDNYEGTGNVIDLADDENWNVRFDGITKDVALSVGASVEGDIDDDGKEDVLIGAFGSDFNGRANSGSLYVVYNTLLDDYMGTGNVVRLGDAGTFNIRFDGALANDQLTQFNATRVVDIDQNGADDLLVGGRWVDGTQADSGALYLLYDELLAGYTGTDNTVDLASSSTWNIRFSGGHVDDLFSVALPEPVDIDNDGILDLVVGAHSENHDVDFDEGSLYVISGASFADVTGTGTTIDMVDTNNFLLRFDSQDVHSILGANVATGDFDDDGKKDIAVSAFDADKPTNGQGKGWVFVFFNTFLDNFTGSGNILSLDDSDNWNIRYVGVAYDHEIGEDLVTADYDHDGADDLFIGAGYPEDGVQNENIGVLYGLYGDTIASHDGIGNSLTFGSDADIYDLRFDGVAGVYFAQGGTGVLLKDINDDGSADVITSARTEGTLGRTANGSTYIIWNFPHQITIDAEATPSDTVLTVTGSVDTPDSVTAVSLVEWSLGDAFDDSWSMCDVDAATTSATFTCEVPIFDGTDTVYVRAHDENGVYTRESNYASRAFTVVIEENNSSGSGGGGGSSRRKSAESTDESEKIAALEQRIAELKAVLAPLLAGNVTPTPIITNTPQSPIVASTISCPAFPKTAVLMSTLTPGTVSPEVTKLQQILNSTNAFAVASAGVGSPGNETAYFGELTRQAVARLQEACRDKILAPLGIPTPTGWVGPMTRAVLNGEK